MGCHSIIKKIITYQFLFEVLLNTGFASVKLSARLFQDNIVVRKSDLLIPNLTTSLLFGAQLTNDEIPKEVALVFELTDQTHSLHLNARTSLFHLNAHQSHHFTNLDFINPGSPFYLKNYQIQWSNEFQNWLATISQLPANTYLLKFSIIDANENQLSVTELPFQISSQPQITLLAPGGPVHFKLPLIFTAFPLFQWESNAKEFILCVCEKLNPTDSPEEALQNEPHLKIKTEQPLLQYPLSGNNVRALMPGGEYYWQVTALFQTPSGTESVASEIWHFKMNPESGTNTANNNQVNPPSIKNKEEIIKLLLAFSNTPELKKQLAIFIQHYGNYEPTGEILIDGQKMSMDELNSFLEFIKKQGYRILKIDIK